MSEVTKSELSMPSVHEISTVVLRFERTFDGEPQDPCLWVKDSLNDYCESRKLLLSSFCVGWDLDNDGNDNFDHDIYGEWMPKIFHEESHKLGNGKIKQILLIKGLPITQDMIESNN